MIKIHIPEDVNYILTTLRNAGYEAYAVGGCVRDSLLNKEPKDWDITTSAFPEQVKTVFPRTIDTGIKHGTVTVMIHGTGYEVTTYRIDGKYLDGRHPENVSFTSNLDEDLKRRDFTINAFVYNEDSGIKDLFGGLKDLEEGIIRCVGIPEERFGEDALRILRAIRFSAMLGFSIEKATYEAGVKLGSTLEKVSSERIKSELDKILLSDNPGHICLLKEMGLDRVVLLELRNLETDGEGQFTCENLRKALTISSRELAIRWAIICYMLEKASCDENGSENGISLSIMKRLKFDNKTMDKVLLFISMAEKRIPRKDDPDFRSECRKLIFFLGKENIYEYISFCEAIAFTDKWVYNDYSDVKKEISDIIEKKECTSIKELAINGNDILMAKLAEGAGVGVVLKKLLNSVLEDSELNKKETLLRLAREL